ncbi:secreted protein [Colletotrichum musicola]|uniref:Secreted protein n=1 Tax=Colletotrichum musicola TaxID=2175873 RepID=A0A8H6KIT2_9PEZI|nr:secreted protein [Colletotrichum musicola]
MPMDMEASIPYVDAPECESLQFADNVDGYRQFSGPANLAGKNAISNELGAIFGKAYRLTIPELLFSMNRAVAGGVNQFVIHGLSYSGAYPQTTWPGHTAFRYAVSDMFSPKRPDWNHGLGPALDYMARIQYVQQTGVPRTDVAFFNKQSVTDPNAGTIYQSRDLISEGKLSRWSYTYLSPDNFGLPQAVVRDRTLAPDGPRFQAMVVLGSQNLTDSGLRRLAEFAGEGLPLIIAGGTPGRFPSENTTADRDAFEAALASLLRHENVSQVPEGRIADALASLNLTPRVGVRTNGTWYTTWREDRKAASGEVIVEPSDIPYFFDAWTGDRKPVLNYRKDGNKTTIPLDLAGNQTQIIAFSKEPLDGIVLPDFFATKWPSNVMGYAANSNEALLHIGSSNRSAEVVLSLGSRICHHSKAPGPFELGPWELVLEHWEAPEDMWDASTVAYKRNSTHQLERLVSWTELPAATNSSGLGYYSANFTWPPIPAKGSNATALGAYIELPAVLNAITVTVNGARLHPLDYAQPVADIAPHLVDGENGVVAVVPSTMWNYVRSILPDIENAGLDHLTNIGSHPDSKTENGLVGSVRIVPYEILRVGLSRNDAGCVGNA